MDEIQVNCVTEQSRRRDQIVGKLIAEKSRFVGSYQSMCFYGEKNWETVYSVIRQTYLKELASDEYPVVAYATNYPECNTSRGFSRLLFTEFFGKSGVLFTTKNVFFFLNNQKICLELDQIAQITVKKGLFENKYEIALKDGRRYTLCAALNFSIMKSLGEVMNKILFAILAKSE